MKAEIKENLNAILELIEDDQFPAKRVIFDYVALLVGDLSNDPSLYREVDNYGKQFFDSRPIQ